MATIRRAGFGTIFELEDSKVGIGTDAATHTLQALGNIRSEDATDIGISSLSTYQGFVDKQARFTTGQIDNQSQSGSTSGEIVIDGDVTVSSATTFTSGPQHLTVTDTFTLPSGDTNSREEKPTAGSLRFNQDFATLEFYTGNNWATVNAITDIQNSPGSAGRMVVFGGEDNPLSGSVKRTIQYQNIHTKGNTILFGSTQDCGGAVGGVSSEIRGVMAGRTSVSESMEYVTLASTGDSIDFGDLSGNREHLGGVSSSTRGIFAGGLTPSATNIMEYVQIMTLGNAVDFGDLTTTEAGASTGSNGTTGIICSDGKIQEITIASTGNSVNVGNDLFSGSYKPGGASSGTRVMWAGGYNGGSGATDYIVNASIRGIDFASIGNATEFGTLTRKRNQVGGGGSRTRGVWMGGRVEPSPSWVNIIDYVSLQSGGSAEDFGDLLHEVTNPYPVSDCHGGLGGY